MQVEDQHKLDHGPCNLRGLLSNRRNRRVLGFILIYFSIQMSVYEGSSTCRPASPNCSAPRSALRSGC
ncbi:hypothetical protein AvCA_32650 [Azotobacter vinelandii CA]|uniref:Uncharacterized protein n=2 Tax=Azotobacter vinelandii TaxID=354 RepID=C1DP69_AZOVD|nr:hypothetical protein Avin_32650 [Azotobacter vinelandii DJ]AGK16384.1 hypothetical protein AvCA_32650 [Azotobacter vinelandii CA]AGK21215.1 hypothetical protein AvCA6_32650 [Azotobacter vinelandii CA6]